MHLNKTDAQFIIERLLGQEPINFMLRSFYQTTLKNRDISQKLLNIAFSKNTKDHKHISSLLLETARHPQNLNLIEEPKIFKILVELQKEKIKKSLKPSRKIIAVYHPECAYRGQTGDIIKKAKRAQYNSIIFVGTICNDAIENENNVYYGGHGIIKFMDFVHLFICATFAHNLPKTSKRVYFVHDIQDSLVSKEEKVLQNILNYDYYFLPSPLVLNRVKNQIATAHERGILKEAKTICLIKGGYIKLDKNLENFQKYKCEEKVIIHAPTVIDPDIEDFVSLPLHSQKIIQTLLNKFPDFKIIFRPHPHTLNSSQVKQISKEFKNNPNFIFDNHPSSYMINYSKSALMVTDLSGTAFTYAFTTLRPVVFFSHNEAKLLEKFGGFGYIQHRDVIGQIAKDLDELVSSTKYLLLNHKKLQTKIKDYRDNQIYNLGKSEDYFINNLGFFLDNKHNEDWEYLNLRPSPPYLIEEGYKEFNIVSYLGKYYGLPQSLGDIDLEQFDFNDPNTNKNIFIGESCDEIKGYINILHQLECKNPSKEILTAITNDLKTIFHKISEITDQQENLNMQLHSINQVLKEEGRDLVTLVQQIYLQNQQTTRLVEQSIDRDRAISNILDKLKEIKEQLKNQG